MPENKFVPASALGVFAHPDDAEFSVAGTVARWAKQGCEVTYVVVTQGDKGTEDPDMTPQELAETRAEEQRGAARILGVKQVVFMGYEDGYLQHTLTLRRDITRLIRRYRPEVVLTFDPTARFLQDIYPNHPDHRAAADATVDAVFPSARDRLTFPELLTEGLQPHKTAQLWMAPTNEPNVWIDIGETLELKKAALLAHTSQIGEDVLPFIDGLAKTAAEGQPMEHAEAFRRIFFDLPRMEAGASPE